MAIPTLDLSLALPGKMRMPYISGGGIEGGRTLSGVVNVIDMTGGGLVCVRYSDIELGNVDPARQRYWSRLGGILNSRVRSIVVPLITDFIAPGKFVATVGAAVSLNSGTLQISVTGMSPTDTVLSGGEWFDLNSAPGTYRAHVITDIDAFAINNDGSASYTVGISPPLRDNQLAGYPINFNRPRCLMRLGPGAQIVSDVDSAWWTTPEVEFIESFGSI